MSGTNEHKKYTLADIEAYLQGRLAPADMHALEKAALQDPFLADAIEGYRNADTTVAKNHLDHIREQLLREEKEVPARIPEVRTGQWWKIAAAIVLVVGAATLAWYTTGTGSKENQVAALPEQKRDTATKHAPVASPDASATAAVRQQSENNSREHKSVTAAPAFEKDIALNETTAKNTDLESLKKDRDATAERSKAADLSDLRDMLRQQTNTDSILSGRVAGISVNKTANLTTLSDLKPGNPVNAGKLSGTVFTSQPDITGSVNAGIFSGSLSAGVQSSITQLGSLTNLTVLSSISDSTLSEVIVTGYAAAKKAAPKKIATDTVSYGYSVANQTRTTSLGRLSNLSVSGRVVLPERTATLTAISDSIAPVGGWDAFKAYMLNTIKATQEKNHLPALAGAVQVELVLSQEGKLLTARVLYIGASSWNTALINILKAGPAWRSTLKRRSPVQRLNLFF